MSTKTVRVNQGLIDALYDISNEQVLKASDGSFKRVYNPEANMLLGLSQKNFLEVHLYALIKLYYTDEDFKLFLLKHPPDFSPHLIDTVVRKLKPLDTALLTGSEVLEILETQKEIKLSLEQAYKQQILEERRTQKYLLPTGQYLKQSVAYLISELLSHKDLKQLDTYLTDSSKDVQAVFEQLSRGD